ncbi:hypothetical protein ACFSJQ_24075 [Vibrio olivae]
MIDSASGKGAGQAKQAAKEWIQSHPQVLDSWLDGVTTYHGEPGEPAVKQSLGI